MQGRGGKALAEERTRGEQLKNDDRELQLALSREKLGYIEDFESEQMELALKYRDAMEGIAGISEKLVGQSVHVINKKLSEEVKSILEVTECRCALRASRKEDRYRGVIRHTP